MNQTIWTVKEANVEHVERWFDFTKAVQADFYNMDLVNNESYCSAIRKNISRGTAIYVEDRSLPDSPIIGAMIYSPNQNHIGWFAVHPKYRRMGVGSSIMEYMLNKLVDAREIKVKTFLYDDNYGKAARSFYVKNGFIGKDILRDEEEYPHPVQVFIKSLREE
ncbi:GNAT family N-acetyltransferase [Wukongibacter baidiensis]|uniref:GNAT family N-acetyltransferase n=1 Tax=Wukongibacter baidiensis TaxID=1723361 RepID=UPI003D7F8F0B